MSPMPSFASHTVTITEPGSRTVYGAPAPDWTEGKTSTRTIDYCVVEPMTSEESAGDPDTVRDGWKIMLPGHETPPSNQAKIRHPFSTRDYQVLGDPLPEPDARGGVSHWFLACERWTTNA